MRTVIDLKQWTNIYKALGNQNRLRILQLLRKHAPLSVSDLSYKLHISFKNTSRNLGILTNLDLIIFEGSQGKVYYRLNQNIPKEIKNVLSEFYNTAT